MRSSPFAGTTTCGCSSTTDWRSIWAGLHSALQGTIDFDAPASELNITVGTTYALDIFHAERHTVESNFRVETTIACFNSEIG